MISRAEVSVALYGAWRLARGDASGLAWFGEAPADLWRSFHAMALVAPLYLVLVLIQAADSGVPFWRYLVLESESYVIAWLVFPLAMHAVSRLLGREERWIRFVIAYNWASVLQNWVYIPIVILGALGVLSGEATAFFGLLALGAILLYSWFVARIALALPPGAAVAVVALDFVLGLVVNGLIEVLTAQG